jgi:poly(3-hydroxybutyrate) depolymerase
MASFAQPNAGVADGVTSGGNYFSRRVEKEKKIVADSIRIEGYWRNFHFRKPNVKSKGFSLVFVMHGSGGSGPGMMKKVPEFDRIADQEKMIAVFPSGYKNFWNECREEARLGHGFNKFAWVALTLVKFAPITSWKIGANSAYTFTNV